MSFIKKFSSLVPRLPDLFNVAREKRGSLVKLITCVTSGGTNGTIASCPAGDAESSNSSISILQTAMNQQVERFHSLRYEFKTAIYTR